MEPVPGPLRPAGQPAAVTARAPAKVNLALGVGPRRDDGFHELRTVFHAVDLDERVTLRPASRLSAAVSGEGAGGLPLDDGNLAVRAVRLVAERAGVEPHVRVELLRSVPVAAGLAGGSADAAAALVAADRLLGARLGRAGLLELAAELGSDVPFSLTGGTALGTGRGEVLTPVLARVRLHWVLAVAAGGLSTPEVYRHLDQMRARDRRVPVAAAAEPVLTALRAGDVPALGRVLVNDLQPAALALRPPLRQTLRAGQEEGALGGLVSGSGPTVALLARDADDAVRLASAMAASGTCRAVRVARGPAAGAQLVDDAA